MTRRDTWHNKGAVYLAANVARNERAIKNALVRLPFGGAKGGVRVAPRDLSEDEQMRLSRRFTSALGSNIGPDYDIPAPDVGTHALDGGHLQQSTRTAPTAGVAGRRHRKTARLRWMFGPG